MCFDFMFIFKLKKLNSKIDFNWIMIYQSKVLLDKLGKLVMERGSMIHTKTGAIEWTDFSKVCQNRVHFLSR